MIHICLLCLSIFTFTADEPWQKQSINTTADFRGLCAVSKDIAWVSGSLGTIGRTIDGGKTWEVITIPGTEKLDFRDIEAFSKDVAYVLSIGPGENSRIYKTTDGGKNWKLQFTNDNPKAFYDAIAFWDEQHGIALSDPVDGRFRILMTEDGGMTWKLNPNGYMPRALDNEGAFAASGTCLITPNQNDVCFVTGGAMSARVFYSQDRGQSWKAVATPMLAAKESAGIFSVAYNDARTGIVVGGDYQMPEKKVQTLAISFNDGKSWEVTNKPDQLPFCSCVRWAGKRWIAVGTTGSFQSHDGKQWIRIDAENYNVVSVSKDGSIWAAGPKSRIARLQN